MHSYLLAFACRLTKNREEAEDLLQESKIKAWDRLETYNKEKSFKNWMLAIITSKHLDKVRHDRRRYKSLPLIKDFEDIFEDVKDTRVSYVRELLEHVYPTLTDVMKITYDLLYNQNMNVSEIARHLKVHTSTVCKCKNAIEKKVLKIGKNYAIH